MVNEHMATMVSIYIKVIEIQASLFFSKYLSIRFKFCMNVQYLTREKDSDFYCEQEKIFWGDKNMKGCTGDTENHNKVCGQTLQQVSQGSSSGSCEELSAVGKAQADVFYRFYNFLFL